MVEYITSLPNKVNWKQVWIVSLAVLVAVRYTSGKESFLHAGLSGGKWYAWLLVWMGIMAYLLVQVLLKIVFHLGESPDLAAVEKHTLDPGQTLLIDDRELGIQAERAAGVRTCLFGVSDLPTPAEIKISQYSKLLELLSNEL